MRKLATLFLSLIAVAALAAPPAGAAPPPGGLTMLGCVSTPTEAALRGCTPGTTALRGMHDAELSPDGKQLYAVGGTAGDGVVGRLVALTRDGLSGALTLGPCRGSVADGCTADDHLDEPFGLDLTPDGADLYVADYSNGIVQYRRAADGGLTFASCLTPTAVSGCTTVPGLTGSGGIAVSPDGKHAYVAGYAGDTAFAFSRDQGSGALSFVGCHTTAATASCTQFGGNGLDDATDVDVAPDGGHVYFSARGDAATGFTRDSASGALSAPQTLSDDYLAGAQTIAVAPDGKTAYVGLFDGSGLTALSLAPATGAPTLLSCLDNETTPFCSASPGVNTVFGLAFSPAGDVLFAASRNGNSLSSFRRSASGSLSLISCVGIAAIPEPGCGQAGNALADVEAVAVSADGRFAYGVGGGSVTTLAVEPPAAPKPPDEAAPPRPILKIVGKRARLNSRGKLKLKLRCVRGAPDVCAGRLSLRSARKLAPLAGASAKQRKRYVKLGGRPFAIRQGKSVRLTITVPKKGRAVVDAKGVLGARLTATVRNPKGKPGKAARRIVLLEPR